MQKLHYTGIKTNMKIYPGHILILEHKIISNFFLNAEKYFYRRKRRWFNCIIFVFFLAPCLFANGKGRIKTPDPITKTVIDAGRFIVSQVKKEEKLPLSQINLYRNKIKEAFEKEDYEQVIKTVRKFVKTSYGIDMYGCIFLTSTGRPVFLTKPNIKPYQQYPVYILVQDNQPDHRHLIWIKHSFLFAKEDIITVTTQYREDKVEDITSIIEFLKKLEYTDSTRIGIISEGKGSIAKIKDSIKGIKYYKEMDFNFDTDTRTSTYGRQE